MLTKAEWPSKTTETVIRARDDVTWQRDSSAVELKRVYMTG